MKSVENPAGGVASANLQLVAWELTRRCNLSCAHCRASSRNAEYAGEMSTAECRSLIDQISQVGQPILILTGGEPLIREDVFPLARYAASRGLRVVMGTNGTLISEDNAQLMKDVPISRVGISLDFPVASLQDGFRGQAGAFDAAMNGIGNARKAGLAIQINCTVTRLNAPYLDQLLSVALDVGAVAFHPFFLVPTGRGKELESVELSSQDYERTLNWIFDRQAELGNRIFFKPTDAPHYLRIIQTRGGGQAGRPCMAGAGSNGGHPANALTRGCLAGTGFCFISHLGRVQGCGYLDVEAGNTRTQTFDDIWSHSPVFARLRDFSNIKGKCGVCPYRDTCGGCRARAYKRTGDYLEAEPYCIYEPPRAAGARQKGTGNASDL